MQLRHITLVALIITAVVLLWPASAKAGTVILRPNSDPTSPVWTPSIGSLNWPILDNTAILSEEYVCRNGSTAADLYGMTDGFVGQGATKITVRAYASMARTLLVLGDDEVGLSAEVGGSLVGAVTSSTPSSHLLSLFPSCPGGLFDWTYGWVTPAVYNGNWTQSQINGMRLYLQKIQNNAANPIRVARAEIEVEYTDPPTLTQSAYRVYANVNSVTPGSPLATTNSAADVSAGTTPFRVRIGTTVSAQAWTANYGSNKLQYTFKNAATCALSTGWNDVVSGSGAIRWYDNSSLADGVAIGAYAGDPVTVGTKVYEQYRESNNFTNPLQAALTTVPIWDFSLTTVSTTPGDHYCLRIANASGSIPVQYTQYPEIVSIGDASVDIVTAGGVSVTNPSVPFTNLVSQSVCQESSGVLGTHNQRIRVNNDRVINGWNMSIAATDGNTATWSSGSNTYEYNNPTGSPAGCGNGQLSLNPNTAVAVPESGCTNTGVSFGSDADFYEGVVDAITLVSASSAAQRFCYWDIMDVAVSQMIPPSQPPGTYTIDLTITALTL